MVATSNNVRGVSLVGSLGAQDRGPKAADKATLSVISVTCSIRLLYAVFGVMSSVTATT